jgi:hypothetical protein
MLFNYLITHPGRPPGGGYYSRRGRGGRRLAVDVEQIIWEILMVAKERVFDNIEVWDHINDMSWDLLHPGVDENELLQFDY